MLGNDRGVLAWTLEATQLRTLQVRETSSIHARLNSADAQVYSANPFGLEKWQMRKSSGRYVSRISS